MIDPIRAEAIRGLYAQMRNTLPATLFMVAAVVGTAWLFTPWAVIAAWTAIILLYQFVRQALIWGFQRSDPRDEELEWWARAFVFYQVPNAVIWGSTMFLFAHPDQPVTVALTLCVLFAGAAGAVPAQAYTPASLNTMVIGFFSFVLVRLVATGDVSYIVLGVVSSLFAVAMIGYCRLQNGVLREGFRIRFENRELVAALTVRTAEAEHARHVAEAASLAKSQFLAAASHDLRQPLYALSLFSTSLGAFKLDSDGRKVVNNIQESVAAMESLFVGLLDVSRLDAGVVKAQLAPVSVDALFDRLSQYFRPAAVERGIELRFRSDNEWVTSDAVLLEQVLVNLVSNALRHTTRGAVLIAARARRGSLRFEVWDTGVGIDQADFQRIFEEFVQIENLERDRKKGLGLGLSIAQRSAALIGCTIGVASRLGRGSRFSLEQPRAPPPRSSGRVADNAAANPLKLLLSRDLPILVVDDDRDVRMALADLLNRWNVRFDIATDAADALSRIAGGARYGLVLADFRLPGALNGLDLIAAITRQHAAPLPAFALITGDFDPALIGAAQERGIPLFHKPLNPAHLRTMLGLSTATDPVATASTVSV